MSCLPVSCMRIESSVNRAHFCSLAEQLSLSHAVCYVCTWLWAYVTIRRNYWPANNRSGVCLLSSGNDECGCMSFHCLLFLLSGIIGDIACWAGQSQPILCPPIVWDIKCILQTRASRHIWNRDYYYLLSISFVITVNWMNSNTVRCSKCCV